MNKKTMLAYIYIYTYIYIAWILTGLTLNLPSNAHNCILRCIHITIDIRCLQKRCSKRKACRNHKQCEALHICIISGRSWFHGRGKPLNLLKAHVLGVSNKRRSTKRMAWKYHKQALDVYKSKFRTFPLTCWCLRAMSWSFYEKTLKFFKDVCQLCFEVFPIAVHQKKGSQVSETGRRCFQIQI